jgi:hypothetical protein
MVPTLRISMVMRSYVESGRLQGIMTYPGEIKQVRNKKPKCKNNETSIRNQAVYAKEFLFKQNSVLPPSDTFGETEGVCL